MSDPAFSVLQHLGFGAVDSESEADLDKRFVRTADFDKFVRPDVWLALGAKGTGKSALFELFTKHEGAARALAPTALADVRITSGTGLSDLSEIDTTSLSDLGGGADFDHDHVWRIYIALRAGLAVKESNHLPKGPLRELSKAVGGRRDFRIGPLLKQFWQFAVSGRPPSPKITVKGVEIDFQTGAQSWDAITLLEQAQEALEKESTNLWVLFDKIDELYPSDRASRQRSLEGLVTAAMYVRRTFPRIQPKVFMRTDLWRHLQFTNKSHLSDKRVELKWSGDQIAAMLLKRATIDQVVWDYVAAQERRLAEVISIEELDRTEIRRALGSLLPEKAYGGVNEAGFVSWLTARVTDGLGTVLPREAIFLTNTAQEIQVESGEVGVGSLIGRDSLLAGFKATSEMRVATYLAEFPDIAAHVQRFQGETTAEFKREDLHRLFAGLTPDGDEVIREFHEVGLVKPMNGDVATASKFEIPRLYRQGLGLIIRGRP